jgi:hypothetical protein
LSQASTREGGAAAATRSDWLLVPLVNALGSGCCCDSAELALPELLLAGTSIRENGCRDTLGVADRVWLGVLVRVEACEGEDVDETLRVCDCDAPTLKVCERLYDGDCVGDCAWLLLPVTLLLPVCDGLLEAVPVPELLGVVLPVKLGVMLPVKLGVVLPVKLGVEVAVVVGDILAVVVMVIDCVRDCVWVWGPLLLWLTLRLADPV